MNYYEKYLKYKQKYLDLKGAGVNDSKPASVNSVKEDPLLVISKKLKKLGNLSITNEEFKQSFKLELGKQKYQSITPIPFNATELKKRDFSVKELIQLGFLNSDLKDAGYNASQLKFLGAKILIGLGFTIQNLKDAGFLAQELNTAGISNSDLKTAGFLAQELNAAGISNEQLKTDGYNASELKFLGVKTLIALNFTIEQLKQAGFTVNDLYDADVGFTVMKTAGYTVSDFKSHPMMNPTLIKSLGFSKQEALDGGYTEAQLQNDY